MLGGKLNFDSRFFVDLDESKIDIGLYELSGVDFVSMSYSNNASVEKILGKTRGVTMPKGPTQQTLSVGRNLIYEDPILGFTGDKSISAHLNYGDEYYGFSKGYLTSYSLNCAVGSVPRITSNFQIYDYLTGSSPNYLGEQFEDHPIIDIPSVVGFDYSIKINRKPHYSIGSYEADVEFIPPIEYSANVTIDIDDAFLKGAKNFLEDRENKSVSISVEGRGGEFIQSVTIPNASLVSEKIEASAESELKLVLTYIGHA
jgi:hypothetical protein